MTGSPPALIVFSGLPGTGKTTVSRILARGLGAVYLRMDSIEQAMRSAGAKCIGPAGYAVANALAESNLRLGLSVVADCVNPLLESRVAWADVAVRASATPLRIHVECSDAAEHRRRWLERGTDIPDLVLPTWEEVVQQGFEPIENTCLRLDTAVLSVEEAVARCRAYLAERLGEL